jgi:hypothetical protein
MPDQADVTMEMQEPLQPAGLGGNNCGVSCFLSFGTTYTSGSGGKVVIWTARCRWKRFIRIYRNGRCGCMWRRLRWCGRMCAQDQRQHLYPNGRGGSWLSLPINIIQIISIVKRPV